MLERIIEHILIFIFLNKIWVFKKPKKFGVLYASTINIGDLIQTLAQIEALKKLGITNYVFVDREKLRCYVGEPINLLMGGWYMHRIDQFPPSKRINPIFISIHISEEILIKKNYTYFKMHEPIGCRDEATVSLFKKNKIKAYLTKCLTLIFDKYEGSRNGFYASDIYNHVPYIPYLPQKFLNSIPSKFKKIQHLGGQITKKNLEQKLQEVKKLLEYYKKAKLVITSRLHCALPCRAFNTPVIFVHSDYKKDPRFTGLHKEINGSDGKTKFKDLDSTIDYNIIAKAQKNLLQDLKHRINKIR